MMESAPHSTATLARSMQCSIEIPLAPADDWHGSIDGGYSDAQHFVSLLICKPWSFAGIYGHYDAMCASFDARMRRIDVRIRSQRSRPR